MTRIERPSNELVARWKAVRREIVADCIGPTGLVDHGVQALLGTPWNIAGPAITVSLADDPDILMAAVATRVARQGDVIVVAAGGRTDRAVWGGGLSLAARSAKVAGIVIDGAVRGTAALIDYGIPLFCRGRQARSAPCQGPGSVNVSIHCGGVQINPGDIVLGDLDGVVVVPLADAGKLIAACEKLDSSLRERVQRIRSGESSFFDEIHGAELVAKAGIPWD